MGSIGPARVLDHVYYWVTDLDRAVAFYRDVLGLPLASREGDEWAEFGAGGTRFALHAAGPGREPRLGGATAVFEVGDLDAAKAELSGQGVVFGHEGAVESYARFASFTDPDGNTLQIIEYDPTADERTSADRLASMSADPRIHPPLAGPERDTLLAFLDYQRDTVLSKIAGADDETLRRSVVPSATTLLGVVKHLAYVEQWWCRVVFAGEDLPDPWPDDDPDADFRILPGETTKEVEALYRDEVDRARAIMAEASLDDRARWSGRTRRGPASGYSLRWIVVHLIEEIARHLGHMDILREQIDGVTGY